MLNEGVCRAIKAVLSIAPSLLYSLVLDCNALSGESLKFLMQGLTFQTGKFKALTIQDNEVDADSIDLIAQLCRRKIPDEL